EIDARRGRLARPARMWLGTAGRTAAVRASADSGGAGRLLCPVRSRRPAGLRQPVLRTFPRAAADDGKGADALLRLHGQRMGAHEARWAPPAGAGRRPRGVVVLGDAIG